MKIFKALIIISTFMLLIACDGINELNAPPHSDQTETSAWQNALAKQNLKLFELPKGKLGSLKKSITEKAYANKNNNIDFDYNYITVNNTTVKIKLRMKIFKDALDEDTDITIEIDEALFVTNLSAKFSPSGTTFNIPAELDLVSVGLEFGEADLSNLKFAYYNESADLWEEMSVKKIKLNENRGSLECKDGKIPHFSRFGFIR